MTSERLEEAARAALALDEASHPMLDVPEGRAQLRTLLARRCLVVHTRLQPADDWLRATRAGEIDLRKLSSEALLLPVGMGEGFRLEDLLCLQWRGPDAHRVDAERWWRRRLPPETQVETFEAEDVSLHAVFAERGQIDTSQRTTYARDPTRGDRVRVEAFELHVTEHCNLRCTHCCNTSPYLPEKTLSPESIRETLRTMAGVLHADVFKIMGGEPLLHPRITEVLYAVRESGVADVVRLFTNGLLLSKMDDDFWRALDHLTVSSYTSAPVRSEHLARIEDKAREFDVVLNVKPVSSFSQVMHDARRHDDAEVKKTWESCWLRHRCLVARDGRFYICTRAAYLPDLHARVQLVDPYEDPASLRLEDSVGLDDPNLGDAVLALLNRKEPLHSCRFCLGGDGPREPHTQLSRDDVRNGRLRRLTVRP